jgi:hypothetical protein
MVAINKDKIDRCDNGSINLGTPLCYKLHFAACQVSAIVMFRNHFTP